MKNNSATINLSHSNRPFDIVGLGAFNVDLIVEGVGDTEDSEGLLPRERLLALGERGRPFLGGSAFNVLSILGRISPLGEESLHLGMIGTSGITGYELPSHADALRALHIEPLLMPLDEASGLCVSLASPTGRKLFVDPGANLRIADFLYEESNRGWLLEQLRECRILHVTSLLDQRGEDKVAQAIGSFILDLRERNQSIVISFDPGAPWVTPPRPKAVDEIFAIADIVFLNEQEFTALTGSVPSDRSALKMLTELCPQAAVHILKDYRSVKIILRSGIEAAAIPQSMNVNAVDPTGAGDAFAAGILFAVASTRSLYEGALLGLKLAALRVSAVGDEGHRNLLKQLGELWTATDRAEVIPRRGILESLAAHASSIRTVAESVIAIGILIAAILTIPAKVREYTDVSYDYVATPKVLAYQYAFPNENDQSQADSVLPFGQHVSVKCRKTGGEKPEEFWLRLGKGSWVRGSDFAPASGERKPEELPECR
jgi:ribokinase